MVPAAALLGTMGLVGLPAGRTRGRSLAALGLLAGGLALLGLGLAAGASELLVGRPSAARASLASGAWGAILMLGASLGFAARGARQPGLGLAATAGLLGFALVAAQAGAVHDLSLAVEFRARRELVTSALQQHLVLSGGALMLAVGATLAVSLWRRGQGFVEMVASGIQVVPAVALFGGLVALTSGALTAMPALRGLGFSALGTGPALVGIAAYLLLPLWRGWAGAMRAPDAAVLDAATAIGLTPGQILARVRLPLGAPILLGALRVAAVQSLGLATLGALIGAGGLGQVVFDGMAQFAPDLILLGALPIVALSLAVERALSLAEAQARRRWRA